MTTNKPPATQEIIIDWPPGLSAHSHYCVGLSGGSDSVVLLFALAKLQKIHNFSLSAIHVNHGLSANANSWEEFCQKWCQQLKIPLKTVRLQVSKIAGQGLENSARQERYLQYLTCKPAVMVLAHHQDDQVETLLSQLLRGSDLHNLAAMRALSWRKNQLYWRPLLNYTKQQLSNYAAQHNLAHIEDESNLNNTYLRNFLRNDIIPRLTHFDNHIHIKLLRSLESIQNQVELSDSVAIQDLAQCSQAKHIDLTAYTQLPKLRQLNVLSLFIRQHQLPLPTTRQLQEFNRQILNAQSDRHPSLKLTQQTIIKRNNSVIAITTNPN